MFLVGLLIESSSWAYSSLQASWLLIESSSWAYSSLQGSCGGDNVACCSFNVTVSLLAENKQCMQIHASNQLKTTRMLSDIILR